MAEYTLKIKKIKTPTDANWVTTIPTEYTNIKGRVYNIVKVEDGGKSKYDKNGYWKATADLMGLINPFTNPISNKPVTETKIELVYKDIYGWEEGSSEKMYFDFLADQCVKKMQTRYKELYGVDIDLSYTKAVEEKKVDDIPPTELSLKYISHVGGEEVKKVTFEVYESVNGNLTLLAEIKDFTAFEIDKTTKKISAPLLDIDERYYASNKLETWLEKNRDKLPKDTKYVLGGYPVEEKKDIKTETKTADNKVVDNNAVSLEGEFTFDVQEENLFKGVNNQFKELEIIGVGEIKETPIDEPVDETIDEEIDEEYLEEETTALSEEDIQLQSRSETETILNSTQKDDAVISSNTDVQGTAVTELKQKDAIITVMDILIKEGGFTKEQAAGICGNIKAESAFKYYNVENGCSNIRPKGDSSKRWNLNYAYGKNYSNGFFSGIGLAQWTWGRRFNMEKYVGNWLKQKGSTAKTLREVSDGGNTFYILDTDPGLHNGDLSKVYGGAGDNLEKYLQSIPNLFEAECSFLQHELKNTYSLIVSMMNGGNPSGNTKTLIGNGFFINKSGGKVAKTVAGYAECVVCNFEVPTPVGKAIKGKSKDKYQTLVAERTKNAMDCLETYNKK